MPRTHLLRRSLSILLLLVATGAYAAGTVQVYKDPG
jgi:hypothetical protein